SQTCASFWSAPVLLALFVPGLTKALSTQRIPDSKAAEKTAALQNASASSYALKPAPAFGVRLSFWRFCSRFNQSVEHSPNPRSKAAEKKSALHHASATYYPLEPAPAFGVRLSFWRFLFPV